MKKFEEELKSGPVSIGQDTITKEYAYDEGTLINYFKDWVSPEDHQSVVDEFKSQLEKQQSEIPEVPQFVADWYEQVSPIFIEACIFDFILSNPQRGADALSEFEKWFMENNNSIEILMDMKRLGYTVAKGKRFYLKNKLTGLYLTLNTGENEYYEHHHDCALKNQEGWKYKFTEQEIDSMETGSYEQIPVKEVN